MPAKPPHDPFAEPIDTGSRARGRRSFPNTSIGALQHSWRHVATLSRYRREAVDRIDGFLGAAGFDKGPWLVVAFASGIAAWFILDAPMQWIIAIGAAVMLACLAYARSGDDRPLVNLWTAAIGLSVMFALGMSLIWLRSETVGAPAIERPSVSSFDARILVRDEQPARDRVRLILAMRNPGTGEAQKVRVNVPWEKAESDLVEGAVIRLRARLMPPAPPMLPGGYDFARTAWFEGFAATGSVLGEISVLEPSRHSELLSETQRRLSTHVRGQLDGSAGAIAAALASGDRGGISEADEDAMRDSCLTHLLSISGLHVSAVIAAAYLLAMRLLALWPWLTLRIRLPLAAAAIGAGAGIAYTLLTGAEVPTVRSCVGAVLVLIALALGREALSMRMVAAAALFVLILWPESLIGPSFQMSFSAVLAIVALHGAAPIRNFLAPRDETWLARTGRNAAMLLLTGLVIEIALMPIVLFHFHRAGLYGAFANMIGIPLTTFLCMPLIALALFLDLFNLGAPAWFFAGQSLDALIGIAHFTAQQPGAVKLMPEMGGALFALFVAGGLWLALWRGRVRFWGLAAALFAAIAFVAKPPPDILVSSDGRHVGIAGQGDRLLMLRDSRSDYAKDNLLELAGMDGEPIALRDWPEARCSRDFCVLTLRRPTLSFHVMMARTRERIDERALAAACERADIVVADRYLPWSCEPRWLKADRRMLNRTGGLTIHLESLDYSAVADTQGQHGWWRGTDD